jgi:NAD(P)-dependent dehydrogenase (short-subunit alcohol dehydrogenase family)
MLQAFYYGDDSGSAERCRTGILPIGHRGVPQDLADLVRFLVGPYARFITGQTIHLNGGMHMLY